MQKIRVRVDKAVAGWFLGLLLDEHGDTVAVVRLDGAGMYLRTYHPSKVEFIPCEEER